MMTLLCFKRAHTHKIPLSRTFFFNSIQFRKLKRRSCTEPKILVVLTCFIYLYVLYDRILAADSRLVGYRMGELRTLLKQKLLH